MIFRAECTRAAALVLCLAVFALGGGCAHLRAPWAKPMCSKPDRASAKTPANHPAIWPVEHPQSYVSSEYGVRRGRSRRHKGLDIVAPLGTPVRSAASGTVVSAVSSGAYGQIIVVEHGNGLSSAYGHLSKRHAEVGQEVQRGEIIGEVGHSGNATTNHLHYEVRRNGTPVNPRNYLP